MAQAPSTVGNYTCTDCGEVTTLNGTFVHAERHRPFEATCADGYTRRYKTADEASEAQARSAADWARFVKAADKARRAANRARRDA